MTDLVDATSPTNHSVYDRLSMFDPKQKAERESSSRWELRLHNALELTPVMLEVVGCDLAILILGSQRKDEVSTEHTHD